MYLIGLRVVRSLLDKLLRYPMKEIELGVVRNLLG